MIEPVETPLENELRRFYSALATKLGMSSDEANEMVIEMIENCKQRGIAEGTADLPRDFGRRMIAAAATGEPKSQRIVSIARADGATNEDIEEWWGLHDLQRRMVKWSEDVFRLSAFRAGRSEGLTDLEAAAWLRKVFPMYGNPHDTSNVQGDDRALPDEIRGRVDRYRVKHGAEAIKAKVQMFSSYNAFVRSEIRMDRL